MRMPTTEEWLILLVIIGISQLLMSLVLSRAIVALVGEVRQRHETAPRHAPPAPHTAPAPRPLEHRVLNRPDPPPRPAAATATAPAVPPARRRR